MFIKKIFDNIDVKLIHDDIDMSLWQILGIDRETGKYRQIGHGGFWEETSCQILLDVKRKPGHELGEIFTSPIIPKDLQDMIIQPYFIPTQLYFKHPNLHKFFLWFTETYGGKIGRAIYYTTPPKYGVKRHRDALPDGQETRPQKKRLYGNKDRFHLILSGKYEFTVGQDRSIGGETLVFSKGELWWFDNKMYHSSFNHSDEDKINLVFDVAGSNWREMMDGQDCEKNIR
jgi:hypothetical protein